MEDPTGIQREREKRLSQAARAGEERSAERRAKELGLTYKHLVYGDVDRENLYLIGRQDAERGQIVVLDRKKTDISVAVVDPENVETQGIIEQLKSRGFRVSVVVVSLSSLIRSLDEYNKVPPPPKASDIGSVTLKKDSLETFDHLKERLARLEPAETSELLEILLRSSLALHASDVHVEPEENAVTIRLRLDGILQVAGTIDSHAYKLLLSRVKLLSGIQLNVSDVPQNGRFTIKDPNYGDVEIRTSVLPGAYGSFIVLRVLDPTAIALTIESVGLRDSLWGRLKPEIEKPNGIVLVTGPTGSGKTTTLYAFLKYLLKPAVKIITLEDPVEYHLQGVSQSQVDPSHGYSFAEGLRSALRQDPDIILVGEIRDEETAQAALNASLTGHFVFSTLHTNDAPGAIPRFLDLNAKPQILASALNAVLAQRLVRVLCEKCKKPQELTAEIFEKIKDGLKHDKDLVSNLKKEEIRLFEARGCDMCSNTGYRGRTGIFEILIVDDQMESVVGSSPSHHDVLGAARKNGFVDMHHDGILKATEGITTIEEVERVALTLE